MTGGSPPRHSRWTSASVRAMPWPAGREYTPRMTSTVGPVVYRPEARQDSLAPGGKECLRQADELFARRLVGGWPGRERRLTGAQHRHRAERRRREDFKYLQVPIVLGVGCELETREKRVDAVQRSMGRQMHAREAGGGSRTDVSVASLPTSNRPSGPASRPIACASSSGYVETGGRRGRDEHPTDCCVRPAAGYEQRRGRGQDRGRETIDDQATLAVGENGERNVVEHAVWHDIATGNAIEPSGSNEWFDEQLVEACRRPYPRIALDSRQQIAQHLDPRGQIGRCHRQQLRVLARLR